MTDNQAEYMLALYAEAVEAAKVQATATVRIAEALEKLTGLIASPGSETPVTKEPR